MTRRSLAALLVAALATTAAAQPAPPSPPPQPQTVPLDVFLEQRVAEELASDGTILSRLGVALDVESVGDKLLVSLVDPATRRAVATTKVDKLPDDREAAVATVTQIVANLTTQLPGNNPTAAAVKTALEEDRVKREQKDLAKAAFEREEIRFNVFAMVSGNKDGTSTTLEAIPYRGGRRLTMPEFFDAVDRRDLTATYNLRRNLGIGGMVIGSAMMFGGLITMMTKGQPDCESLTRDACWDEGDRWQNIGIGVMLGGVLVGTGGYGAYRYANPVDDRGAHDLADAYNAKLRVKHGIPTSQAAKRFHDVALSPRAGFGGGGLTLSGRF